jgi:hypothetical protein
MEWLGINEGLRMLTSCEKARAKYAYGIAGNWEPANAEERCWSLEDTREIYFHWIPSQSRELIRSIRIGMDKSHRRFACAFRHWDIKCGSILIVCKPANGRRFGVSGGLKKAPSAPTHLS